MPRRKPDPPDQLAADAAASAEEIEAAAAELAASFLGALTRPGRPATRSSASRKRIPLSLRRAANRAGGPRTAEPPQRLVDAADAGLLTRSNTRPGSAGRRAVDRAVYLRRRAAKPGLTAREALGHERSGLPDRRMSTILVGRGFVTVEKPGGADARRIARYDAYIGQLRQGEISERTFERKVRSWRPFHGESFESDPAAVLAILAERAALGLDLFEYTGRRS